MSAWAYISALWVGTGKRGREGYDYVKDESDEGSDDEESEQLLARNDPSWIHNDVSYMRADV